MEQQKDATRRGGIAAELAATTFAILVVELALIRRFGTQIRIAAYFANLVLIATFSGWAWAWGWAEGIRTSRVGGCRRWP